MTLQRTSKALAAVALAVLAVIAIYRAEIWVSNYLGSMLASGQHSSLLQGMIAV